MTVDHTCSPGRLFAAALAGHAVDLLDEAARTRPLAVWRWNDTTDSDRYLLSACAGATLDVGCGPGRMTSELAGTGAVVLGIDIVPEAIRQTRERGGQAMLRDVFADVPGAGRWQTVLLADGNIGIGGDPVRLLRRVVELLSPDGRVVVDLQAPGRVGSIRTHRLSGGGLVSEPFPWAVVGIDEIEAVAGEAGLVATRTESHRGRWFAVLEREQ